MLGLAASVGASATARSLARGRVHRVRVLCGLAPLVCGVLLMLAALPPEALASAIGVRASLPANAGTNPNASLAQVSCASAGNCTAVGDYTDRSGHGQGLLLTETSGTWAAGVEASLPANASTHPHASLGSVSCASAGNCTAVGYYTDRSRHGGGLLLTETSGRWAAGVEAALPADTGLQLSSVSCVSAGNCTAVGDYSDRSRHEQGLLLTETSGRWAAGVKASLPANARTDRNASLAQVSCASAGNCTAVGHYTDSSGHGGGLLLTETSGRWAAGVEASLPADTGTTTYAQLYSVSCASAGNCSAVGNYIDNSGYGQGLLLTETSGTWAAGVEASMPANRLTNRAASVVLGPVSCASAGNCTAVGDYPGNGSEQGVLLTETSGRWTAGVDAALPADAGTTTYVQLFSVSCASAGNCTAGGYYIDNSGHEQGLLLTETSGTWAAGVEASLPANAGTNPDAQALSVSCASAGSCTAVGTYDDSSGHEQGLLLTETSGTWAAGVEASLPANAGTNPAALIFWVSCSSAGSCSAVGTYYDSSSHGHGLLVSVSALALIGSPTSNAAGVTDKLICAPSALPPCQATETLTTTETTRGGRPVALSASPRRKSHTVIVAAKTVMIQPGRTVTVTVNLSATGRKLLARFGKLPVTLTITLLQNGGHLTIANTKLTIESQKT